VPGFSAGTEDQAPGLGQVCAPGGPALTDQGGAPGSGWEGRSSHTVVGVVIRANLRLGSRVRREPRAGSGLERARPGPGGAGLGPRSSVPQAVVSWAAAAAPRLQDHLREGTAITRRSVGVDAWGRGSPVRAAPGRGGCGTRVRTAGLLRAQGAARPPRVSTPGRDSGTCGTREAGAGEVGPGCRSASPAALTPPRTALSAPPPLHVGVLQRLGGAKPLVRGKHQEPAEEVQGLWRGVRWQEGVQSPPWPTNSCLLSPLQGPARGPFPHLPVTGD
jgi:hypothetical protein